MWNKIKSKVKNASSKVLNAVKRIYDAVMKRISEAYDMKVFTDTGDYFGDIEESILTHNKVFGWRVKATRNSFLNSTCTNPYLNHLIIEPDSALPSISK